MTHQEAVAEVRLRGRILHADGAVEHAERDLAAAVRHVEQQRAVAAAGIDRPQQVEVRRALDEPLGVARSSVEVGDLLVELVRGVDREAQHAGDLLVCAGRAEGATGEHGLTLLDVEADDGHGSRL